MQAELGQEKGTPLHYEHSFQRRRKDLIYEKTEDMRKEALSTTTTRRRDVLPASRDTPEQGFPQIRETGGEGGNRSFFHKKKRKRITLEEEKEAPG